MAGVAIVGGGGGGEWGFGFLFKEMNVVISRRQGRKLVQGASYTVNQMKRHEEPVKEPG